MGFWTYYCPILVGIGLVLALNNSVRGLLPVEMSAEMQWVVVGGIAVCVGLACQLVMIGVQGAFAQVLPVPRGRSIRGRGAVAGGWLVLGCAALAVVTALLRSERMGMASLVVGGLAAAMGIGAVLTYIWCWPTATRDFAKDRAASV